MSIDNIFTNKYTTIIIEIRTKRLIPQLFSHAPHHK